MNASTIEWTGRKHFRAEYRSFFLEVKEFARYGGPRWRVSLAHSYDYFHGGPRWICGEYSSPEEAKAKATEIVDQWQAASKEWNFSDSIGVGEEDWNDQSDAFFRKLLGKEAQ